MPRLKTTTSNKILKWDITNSIFHRRVGGGGGRIEKLIVLTSQLRFCDVIEFLILLCTLLARKTSFLSIFLYKKGRKNGPFRLSNDM